MGLTATAAVGQELPLMKARFRRSLCNSHPSTLGTYGATVRTTLLRLEA